MRAMTIVCLTLAAALGWTGDALACRHTPLQPSDEQLAAAPADIIAFKGRITRISLNGEMKGIPHAGFSLDLQVLKVFRGDLPPAIVVHYGGCDFVYGRVGDTINVMAQKMPDGILMSR